MAGRLRVTGGTLARRLFDVPPGADRGLVRPTSDRVREAVFSSLGPLEDGQGLDLFAGSGALGIEALSRGLTTVTFVDRSAQVLQTLRKNLSTLGLSERAILKSGAALQIIAQLSDAAFDLILVDPPYALDVDSALRAQLARVLAPTGKIVIERDKRALATPPDGFSPVFDRNYGDTNVRIWERTGMP